MENLRKDGDNLIGTPVFDEQDAFAKKIADKWERGFLKMASAGLDLVEQSTEATLLLPGQTRATVTKSKLIEVSIVDIGANDDALALYRQGKRLDLAKGEGADALEVIKDKDKKDFKDHKKKDSEKLFNNSLNMEKIALKLGLPEGASEAEVLAAIGGLQANSAKAVELQKEVDTQKEAAIAGAVDAAVKLKKITAEKRDLFITLGKTSGIDALQKTLDCIAPAVKPTEVLNHGGGHHSAGSGTAAGEYKKLGEVPDEERIALRKDDPEKYKALYKAEYGVEAELT
jgi:hypothetical protein